MSFQRMQDLGQTIYHERVGILLYNFTEKEVKQISNVIKLVGIKDVIQVGPENGEQTLTEILDGKTYKEVCTDVPGDKTIIFNGVEPNRVNSFIDILKKYRFKRPLIAMVTEQSIQWQLKVVLENLIEERSGLARNSYKVHND